MLTRGATRRRSAGLPAALLYVELASPIFRTFFPEIHAEEHGLNCMLTNGVGRQRKTGKTPRIQEARTRFSGKKFQKFRVQLARFANSDVPGRTHRN
jgi:hypothetical protein